MSNKTLPFSFHEQDCKITLYKNGDNPNIYYYFTFNKTSFRGSTGTTDINNSREKAKSIFYDVIKGLKEKGVKKNIKFEKLVKDFLKYKEHKVSPRTLDDYKKSSKYLIEKFKNKEVEKICDVDEYSRYQDWRRTYYDTHKSKRRQVHFKDGDKIIGRKLDHVGIVVINHECRLLVSILRYAKDVKKIFKTEIPKYSVLKPIQKSEQEEQDSILTGREYLKLRNYWMKKKPFYGYIISFLYNTGIRYSSELNRIKWKDVNLEKSYVIIRNRKSIGDQVTTSVPIIDSVKRGLEYLKARKGISTAPNDFVFVDDNGKQIKRISRSFKKSLIECGIKKNIVMYSFRHMFTTRMIQRPDLPIADLAYILGHKNTNTLQKHYAFLSSDRIIKTFLESEQNMNQKFEEKRRKKQLEAPSKTTV